MISPEQQNVFTQGSEGILPGPGWATFASIFQASGRISLLGEVTGMALLRYPTTTYEAGEVRQRFADAARPPIRGEHADVFEFGFNKAVQQFYLSSRVEGQII